MTRVPIKNWVHANICVRDMEQTIPFYEMLGFEKFSDLIFEDSSDCWRGLGVPPGQKDRRFRAVFMRIPNVERPILDIIQFLDPSTAGEPYPTLTNVGTCRLCFEVDDIDAVAKLLADNGVEMVSSVARYETSEGVAPNGQGARFLCFRDPDGTFLEYVSFRK
ncbi:catechol 2,3-dioxygenase-like lactoylglutathione lyase family enzyme [Bradyrhizobium sp. CIR48]|uniref:VOC family protein n=1 Tax=Bradyrhizobium sp. CIR48 TaxID=2663840 RepID=UPI001605DB8D|nr:VOC family protein [Bradyrhizobium sp. CIR48]MBB4425421.1 catechol 2,3-dioxygenase-like lactoylglutathione lyase family enzyme [Bradyrhizobium sp. CIR48]